MEALDNVYYLPSAQRQPAAWEARATARTDRHHVLFDRKTWVANDVRKTLRNNHWLVVPLPRPVHEEIHQTVDIVPPLDYHTLARTTREFEPVPGDHAGSVENLCRAIETATEHPRTSQLTRELGALTVWALELQLPFIREGETDGAA